jgi:AcrR family transcriptional regulator
VTRGRRSGDSGTREAILDAARKLFAERGYNGASLRAIAAEAGVDPALAVHYFGSKAKLLTASVRWPFDPDAAVEEIVAAGRGGAGEAVARLLVTTWDELGDANPIITLLRSAMTEPEAAAAMREFLSHRLLGPITERLGVDDAPLRAGLVASQLLGVALTRYILRMEPLASLPATAVIELVGATVQRLLTESE